MKNNLVVSGCSFFRECFPKENPNRKRNIPLNQLSIDKLSFENRFSKTLSDELNMKEVNLSSGGASNRSICERVIDFLIKESNSGDIVIIGLSELYRERGVMVNDNPIEYIDWDPLKAHKYESYFAYYMERWFNKFTKYDIKTFISVYLSKFHNETILKTDLKRNINVIKLLCEQKGVHLLLYSAILSEEDICEDLDTISFPNGKREWRKWIQSYDEEYRLEHANDEDHDKFKELIKMELQKRKIIDEV